MLSADIPFEGGFYDFYDKTASGPLLIIIHGGYWQEGTRALFCTPIASLVARGWRVATLGYRLVSAEHSLGDAATWCSRAITVRFVVL